MKDKCKRAKVYCSNCDKVLVEVGTKCAECGHRELAVKIKKREALRNAIKDEEWLKKAKKRQELNSINEYIFKMQLMCIRLLRQMDCK